MTLDLARQSYTSTQKELGSDKATERLIFTKIVGELQAVDLNSPTGMVDLAHAVTRNTQLWNLIRMDLLHENNELPLPLKTSMIGLSEFVQRHSLKVMAGEASHDILIDINRSILAGLAGIQKPVIDVPSVEAA